MRHAEPHSPSEGCFSWLRQSHTVGSFWWPESSGCRLAKAEAKEMCFFFFSSISTQESPYPLLSGVRLSCKIQVLSPSLSPALHKALGLPQKPLRFPGASLSSSHLSPPHPSYWSSPPQLLIFTSLLFLGAASLSPHAFLAHKPCPGCLFPRERGKIANMG